MHAQKNNSLIEIQNNFRQKLQLLFEEKKVDEGVVCARQYIDRYPRDGYGYKFLGSFLMQQRDFDSALQNFIKANELTGGDADCFCSIGTIYKLAKNDSASLAMYYKSLTLDDKNIGALNNLAIHHQDNGDYLGAVSCYKKILETNKGDPVVLNNIGLMFFSAGLYDDAILYFDAAYSSNKSFFAALGNIGICLREKGDVDASIDAFLLAISHDDNNPGFYYNLAVSQQESGLLQEANVSYRRCLDISCYFIESYYGLCMIGDFELIEKNVLNLESIFMENNLGLKDKMIFCFVFAKFYDYKCLFDKAFFYLEMAHSLRFKFHRFKADLVAKEIERNNLSIRLFSKEYFRKSPVNDSCRESPIFIVGMPRSGTSLVEKIIASHPNVHALGEFKEIELFSESVFCEGSSYKPPAFDQEALKTMSVRYFSQANFIPERGERLTDKMPHNFRNLWLIYQLFPRAKILHCVRNPLDNCLSIFFQNFTSKHAYSDKIQTLAEHYVSYRTIMNHWHSVLPITIYDVEYERLVNDFNNEVGKLLDFCGLEQCSSCYEYYKTPGNVKTASSAQVRQRIFKNSIGKWRNYEKHLARMKIFFDTSLSAFDSRKDLF